MTDKSLIRSTPEEQGISSKAIMNFLQEIKKEDVELHSFMMIVHGKVVAEGSWKPYSLNNYHTLYSLSKAFTSTAVGICYDRKLINLNDKVISFFPEDLPDEVGENLAALEVEHLLKMAIGRETDSLMLLVDEHNNDKFGITDNWVRTILKAPIQGKPGETFLYDSGATYLLSAIVQKVTGENVCDFLTPLLFDPLGIKDIIWDNCPKGIFCGGWGLSIKAEDIAKFVSVYLNKGTYNGSRILSKEWVDMATKKHISNGDDPDDDWSQGYGYQFWRCRHNTYRASGAFGQIGLVIPDKDAIVVLQSGTNSTAVALEKVWEELLSQYGKCTDKPGEDYKKLQKMIDELEILPLEDNDKRYKVGSRLKYVFGENASDYESIGFEFRQDECIYHSKIGGIENEISCNFGSWADNVMMIKSIQDITRNNKIAACVRWESENKLLLKIQKLQTPHSDTFSFTFKDDEIIMDIERNVNYEIIAPEVNGYIGKLAK